MNPGVSPRKKRSRKWSGRKTGELAAAAGDGDGDEDEGRAKDLEQVPWLLFFSSLSTQPSHQTLRNRPPTEERISFNDKVPTNNMPTGCKMRMMMLRAWR
jgi:hypothetical protein